MPQTHMTRALTSTPSGAARNGVKGHSNPSLVDKPHVLPLRLVFLISGMYGLARPKGEILVNNIVERRHVQVNAQVISPRVQVWIRKYTLHPREQLQDNVAPATCSAAIKDLHAYGAF